jgi:hypothetical protein
VLGFYCFFHIFLMKNKCAIKREGERWGSEKREGNRGEGGAIEGRRNRDRERCIIRT